MVCFALLCVVACSSSVPWVIMFRPGSLVCEELVKVYKVGG